MKHMDGTMEAPKSVIQRADTKGMTWSLDRRLPIPLLVVAAIQLLGIAWFAIGPLPDRHYQNGHAVSFETETANLAKNWIGISETLSRIEDNLDKSHAALIRIERMITRYPDQRP